MNPQAHFIVSYTTHSKQYGLLGITHVLTFEKTDEAAQRLPLLGEIRVVRKDIGGTDDELGYPAPLGHPQAYNVEVDDALWRYMTLDPGKDRADYAAAREQVLEVLHTCPTPETMGTLVRDILNGVWAADAEATHKAIACAIEYHKNRRNLQTTGERR